MSFGSDSLIGSDWARGSLHLEFEVGDHVFLKVMPKRGVVKFGKRKKLSPKFIGPFEILERVGTVVYRLALRLAC